MKSFLLMIFVVYGGVHLYLFLRLKNLFRFGLTATLMVSLCMVAMVLAPILVRFFEREGWAWGARLSAHVGYTWMGFVFVTFLLCLLGDLLSLALLTAKAAGLQELYISPRPLTALALVLGLIICVYGVYEARDIQTSVSHNRDVPYSPARGSSAHCADFGRASGGHSAPGTPVHDS